MSILNFCCQRIYLSLNIILQLYSTYSGLISFPVNKSLWTTVTSFGGKMFRHQPFRASLASAVFKLLPALFQPSHLIEKSPFKDLYIVDSRGASQLGGIFQGTLQGIRLISYSFTKLPSWYNKNTCLMFRKQYMSRKGPQCWLRGC